MNVSRERPDTDLDLVIFKMMRMNPNVWTVPESVNSTENYLSLKPKKRRSTTATKPIQYRESALFKYFIYYQIVIAIRVFT
jgi:hypothetical protein